MSIENKKAEQSLNLVECVIASFYQAANSALGNQYPIKHKTEGNEILFIVENLDPDIEQSALNKITVEFFSQLKTKLSEYIKDTDMLYDFINKFIIVNKIINHGNIDRLEYLVRIPIV
jgi:hypothetical protein